MKAITVRKPIQFDKMLMKERELYIFNDAQTELFTNALRKSNQLSKATIKPLADVLREFPCNEVNHIFIIRAGGIGDLIALSSLCAFININMGVGVTVITQSKYKALFDWFASR